MIKAFNDNMPFDQFTVEQLAGDLLPADPRTTDCHRIPLQRNDHLRRRRLYPRNTRKYVADESIPRPGLMGTSWPVRNATTTATIPSRKRMYYQFFRFLQHDVPKMDWTRS